MIVYKNECRDDLCKKNAQIVIVEDDKDLCAGLCKALKDESRCIVSCDNLKGAREQIFLTNPALILLDINLPDGNGLDLVKEIRERKTIRRILPHHIARE
ncbi:response regulator [Butyrivibrio sp. WCE2006]|uniref:response regulator n=1 Tax=Butyrivibrio sp. WCE2006 TaxID=1410611 RepID=UPI0005D2BEC0